MQIKKLNGLLKDVLSLCTLLLVTKSDFISCNYQSLFSLYAHLDDRDKPTDELPLHLFILSLCFFSSEDTNTPKFIASLQKDFGAFDLPFSDEEEDYDLENPILTI